MSRIIIAVDGSEVSTKAVQYAMAEHARYREPPSICLVTVQMPIGGVNV